jgi:hypothetical protein
MDGTGEFNILEGQVAIGASYPLADGWWVYLGPYLQWVSGDFDFEGEYYDYYYEEEGRVKGTHQVHQESEIGGFFGVQGEYKKSIFYVEGQFTGDSYVIASGVVLLL